jgi:hypothetical protein
MSFYLDDDIFKKILQMRTIEMHKDLQIKQNKLKYDFIKNHLKHYFNECIDEHDTEPHIFPSYIIRGDIKIDTDFLDDNDVYSYRFINIYYCLCDFYEKQEIDLIEYSRSRD